MKVYLNTNIVCRPFDDVTQKRIQKESLAVNRVFLMVLGKLVSIVISEVVLSEIELTPNSEKRKKVYILVGKLPKEVVVIDSNIIKIADEFLAKRVIMDYMDILHLSCAMSANVDFFITCDDELLDKKVSIENHFGERFEILNPIDFIKLMEVRV